MQQQRPQPARCQWSATTTRDPAATTSAATAGTTTVTRFSSGWFQHANALVSRTVSGSARNQHDTAVKWGTLYDGSKSTPAAALERFSGFVGSAATTTATTAYTATGLGNALSDSAAQRGSSGERATGL